MHDMTRRNFIAGAGTAACTSLAAGMALADEPTAANGKVPEAWDFECDLLVLGAGSAGLSAAYAAAVDGQSVIVLEREDNVFTSSTCYCMGNYSACCTDRQEEAGIEDSPEAMAEDMLAWGGADGDYPSADTLRNENLVHTFTENCTDAYNLLRDWGLEFGPVINSSGHSTNRTYVTDPRQLCALLEEHCVEEGVEIKFETPFTELIADGDGTVLGAYATDPDGNTIAIRGMKATVLATGAFMRNDTMMEEMLPGASKVDKVTGLGAYGDGFLAAMQLGAAMWGRSNLYFVEGYEPSGTLNYCELCQFGAILVNKDGERFTDDGQYWSNSRSRDLIKQGINPDTGTYFAYTVIDQNIYDAAMAQGNPLGLTESKLEYLVSGETIEELAEKINAPKLAETLAKYNEDMANGEDTLFHRRYLNGAGTGDPFPLDKPPYYAWANRPCILYAPTIGFICDDDFPAVDQYKRPVGGGRLFVLGEMMLRSIEGNHYLVGSAISACVTFGLLVGAKIKDMEPAA